jgi:hypothetical protein
MKDANVNGGGDDVDGVEGRGVKGGGGDTDGVEERGVKAGA